jgi:hypothetical protein
MSGKAVAAFLAGLSSVACGLLTLASGSDLFLLGVVLFGALALGLEISSRIEIKRSPSTLRGKALAGWGMGLPAGGFALGFLVLPAT